MTEVGFNRDSKKKKDLIMLDYFIYWLHMMGTFWRVIPNCGIRSLTLHWGGHKVHPVYQFAPRTDLEPQKSPDQVPANAVLPRYHKAILIPNSYWPSRNKTPEYQPLSPMLSLSFSPPAATLHSVFSALNVIATFVKQVKRELRKWIRTFFFLLKFTRSTVHSCFNNPSKTRDLIGRSSMSN